MRHALLNLSAYTLPILLILQLTGASAVAQGGSQNRSNGAMESARRTAEAQVRNLLEPLLDKYCRDECRLMSVNAQIDLAAPDQLAPGFDDIDPKSGMQLAPTSARVKILVDDKVGPVSRSKLLDLMQQYLDTLDFQVKIDTQLAHFPQPIGSAGKVAEMREKISKQFRTTVEGLFQQFCPNHCLLADFDLKTDTVNAEEAQYGSSGEYMEDNGIALRIKDISGTILVDEQLPADERANILEMAKLKTNFYKNVNLVSKSLRFPRPGSATDPRFANGQMIGAIGAYGGTGAGRDLASENRKINEQNSQTNSNNSTANSLEKNTNQTENSNNTTSQNQSSTSSSEKTNRQERFEKFEKIERVENGDAVQAELQKFKVYGLVLASLILALLVFVAASSWRPRRSSGASKLPRFFHNFGSFGQSAAAGEQARESGAAHTGADEGAPASGGRGALISKRYEIESLLEEMTGIFAQHPRVAKYVFTRVLTEEGVETTAAYIQLFGESVVIDMLRDPSLQADLNELMEFYAKNPMDLTDDEKIDLLRKLHNRTVAGKLVVMRSRSSNLFDFLAEMDGIQILELIRNESLTVKSIVLTQVDPQKRAAIYAQVDEDTRMKLLNELSRIDYLPRDYIFNVATALKRKRRENPRLNTEALPGSDVLLTLLEKTGKDTQRNVLRNLEITNPDSARTIKGKLVSLDTLRYLRDGQLLEVVLSLRHDELVQFLKGAPLEVRNAFFAKSPRDLVAELEDELTSVQNLSREGYQAIERKVINRIKVMAGEGLINLIETNERLLADGTQGTGYSEPGTTNLDATNSTANIKKVAGW